VPSNRKTRYLTPDQQRQQELIVLAGGRHVCIAISRYVHRISRLWNANFSRFGSFSKCRRVSLYFRRLASGRIAHWTELAQISTFRRLWFAVRRDCVVGNVPLPVYSLYGSQLLVWTLLLRTMIRILMADLS
jgi:hypothetical protein